LLFCEGRSNPEAEDNPRSSESSCHALNKTDADAPDLAASELNNFPFEIGLSFAFRDERLDSFVDYIGDPHTVSLCCLAKPSQLSLVKAIERPATFENKGGNIARSGFWRGFHAAVFRCFLHARKKLLRGKSVTEM
jgi:hypothetical protein